MEPKLLCGKSFYILQYEKKTSYRLHKIIIILTIYMALPNIPGMPKETSNHHYMKRSSKRVQARNVGKVLQNYVRQ